MTRQSDPIHAIDSTQACGGPSSYPTITSREMAWNRAAVCRCACPDAAITSPQLAYRLQPSQARQRPPRPSCPKPRRQRPCGHAAWARTPSGGWRRAGWPWRGQKHGRRRPDSSVSGSCRRIQTLRRGGVVCDEEDDVSNQHMIPRRLVNTAPGQGIGGTKGRSGKPNTLGPSWVDSGEF